MFFNIYYKEFEKKSIVLYKMKNNQVLMLVVAFLLGYFFARQMCSNRLVEGVDDDTDEPAHGFKCVIGMTKDCGKGKWYSPG